MCVRAATQQLMATQYAQQRAELEEYFARREVMQLYNQQQQQQLLQQMQDIKRDAGAAQLVGAAPTTALASDWIDAVMQPAPHAPLAGASDSTHAEPGSEPHSVNTLAAAAHDSPNSVQQPALQGSMGVVDALQGSQGTAGLASAPQSPSLLSPPMPVPGPAATPGPAPAGLALAAPPPRLLPQPPQPAAAPPDAAATPRAAPLPTADSLMCSLTAQDDVGPPSFGTESRQRAVAGALRAAFGPDVERPPVLPPQRVVVFKVSAHVNGTA